MQPAEPEYLARNALWQPVELRARIASAHVVLLGMGGLGWAIGASLLGLGVRRFSVFDPDVLDLVNLNRLFGCGRGDAGAAKVDLFAARARAVDPAIEVGAHRIAVPAPELEALLPGADVVFGGFDRPEPRVATQVLTKMYGCPYVDSGVAIVEGEARSAAFGQVFVSADRTSPCLVCAGLRLASPGYLRGDGLGPVPSSGVLNGVIANLAVSVWLEMLAGRLEATMTRFAWGDLGTTRSSPRARSDCALCGLGALSPSSLEVDLGALGLALAPSGGGARADAREG